MVCEITCIHFHKHLSLYQVILLVWLHNIQVLIKIHFSEYNTLAPDAGRVSNGVQSSKVQETMTRAVTGVASPSHSTGGSSISTNVRPRVSTTDNIVSKQQCQNKSIL